MNEDSVIAEVRRIKEEIAAEYNYDVRALAAALRREQEQAGRKTIRLQPKMASKAAHC